ncbi:MAG: nucleotidyl transferase AbiEii/AbiGii toxin family protein [Clostridia bacterium]
MIKTTTQLKAKIRNLSDGNSLKAQALIRNYIMERFLERISLSDYRDNLILKGGMLVSSIVGLETRTTMDIDTTIQSLLVTMSEAKRIIEAIISVVLEDNVSFNIKKIEQIMEDFDYPGIRFILEASLDNLRQVIKIDISTNDVITPSAIVYQYRLMFEDRNISLKAYNLETLLGEKIETVISRGTANTRMRDFYDIHTISTHKTERIDYEILQKALLTTSKKRNTLDLIEDYKRIIDEVRSSGVMKKNWDNYSKDLLFYENITWIQVVDSLVILLQKISIYK